MIGSVILEIPLKIYLKKYLIKVFGEEHLATRDSWFGIYLSDILTKEYTGKTSSLAKDSSYTVIIPSSIALSSGFSISKAKYNRLENMIRKVFYSELYSYISISIANELKINDDRHDSIIKQNRMRAIQQFLNFYDINEDDLNSDSVYRQVQRHFKN